MNGKAVDWRVGRPISLLLLSVTLAANAVAVQAQSVTTSTTTTPIFVTTTILPTDVASWGGQLGAVKGRVELKGPPDLSAWLFHGQAQTVERDSRYSFTGTWSYFGQIDSFLSMLGDKVPALQKVSGELRTPCTSVSQSMPPVPELPSPEKVGSKTRVPAEQAGKDAWRALSPAVSQATKDNAAQGKLIFSHKSLVFSGGSSPQNQNIVIGSPGTLVLAKSWSAVTMKAGRAYVYNGSVGADLAVESGRVKALLPPGASGILDTAPNGLTRYLALTGPAAHPVVVFDACNPNTELSKLEPGELVTVAQEDAIAEDLIPPAILSETVEQGAREEGYLLVKGHFSLEDALMKDSVLSATTFQTNPVLKDQRDKLATLAHEHPWTAGTKMLTASVQQAGDPHPRGEASFMPTRGARYGRVSDNELLIADGAVLVKGGEQPVIISTEVNKQKVMVRVRSGAVVMVSALDGRATVLNLTDSAPASCSFYLPAANGKPYQLLNVETGQVAEFYINDGLEPASTVLAYRVVDKKSLPGDVGVLIAKYDYLAAMKRFNLSFALPSPDLNRVMKTMAASAFLMQYRSGQ